MSARPSKLPTLLMALLAAGALSAARGAVVIGDRLVAAINNVPYSQRQVEIYVTVKESLRKTAAGDAAVRIVDQRNWSDALSVFTEDMIILQEAQRLGSFATLDQTVEKFAAVVQEKAAKPGPLRSTLERLSVSDQVVGHTLEDVLRVAAFRRARERPQDAATVAMEADAPGGAAKRGGAGAPPWLIELTDRAVVRLFTGAEVYQDLSPPLAASGKADNAP